MSKKRLNIAFWWHMHQPLYKDPYTGEFLMPWVLLHGTKDYLDMVAILDKYPEIKQTFNIVPSLIEQINEYAGGDFKDTFVNLTKKRVSDLSASDKEAILRSFFQANLERMIRPSEGSGSERYFSLLLKRGFSDDADSISKAVRYFTDGELLDLQVLFNLVWIDPMIVAGDKTLTRLKEKGRGYTEDDKAELLKKQVEIMGAILPKLKDSSECGQIEVTTTPYYHPILPLLCDSESALVAMPGSPLPTQRFRHPEDAAEQIRRGISLHRDTFGIDPKGMWPSEGSVSPEIIPMIHESGIRWIGTDEDILARSRGIHIERDGGGHPTSDALYRRYSVGTGKANLGILFRDRKLSDLIGFDYSKGDPEAAAHDLISRLLKIRSRIDSPQEAIVPIILDGENAWEYYANDGHDFLNALYTGLTENNLLECVRISDFMEGGGETEHISKIFSGSWINHNFRVWIGHDEDNRAWDMIETARKVLVREEEGYRSKSTDGGRDDRFKLAWEELYAAEGSDWFWWYGDDHASANDEIFDILFRRRIKRIYDLLEVDPPLEVDMPIIQGTAGIKPEKGPSQLINVTVDGTVTDYFEWQGAGELLNLHSGSAMHREEHVSFIVDSIYYGFSDDEIFFRFDYSGMKEERITEGWGIEIVFLTPKKVRIMADIKGDRARCTVKEGPGLQDSGGPEELKANKGKIDGLRSASGDIVEVGVPLSLIGGEVKREGKVSCNSDLFITIKGGLHGEGRWPTKGHYTLEVPGRDFENLHWMV